VIPLGGESIGDGDLVQTRADVLFLTQVVAVAPLNSACLRFYAQR